MPCRHEGVEVAMKLLWEGAMVKTQIGRITHKAQVDVMAADEEAAAAAAGGAGEEASSSPSAATPSGGAKKVQQHAALYMVHRQLRLLNDQSAEKFVAKPGRRP